MDFPTFLLALLSGDWVFFDDGNIAWDGEHHQITGIQVNGAQAEQFMPFVNTFASDFDDIEDVVNHLIGFMSEIEKDEGLRIPRGAIAPGIRQAIREGDLTGITLMNLAACGAAFSVRLMDEKYVVLYDTRLAMGIPAFFDLIARLLWDLRQYLRSLMGVPFEIAFASARNFDADQCLGDVSKPVLGAQTNPQVMIVDSLPEIRLDGEEVLGDSEADGDNACYVPFASGFDDPDEAQADEELFETAVNSLMREFPLTMPIEGTHVLGRAQRIESVKVGDSIVLAADWQSPYFTPACIEVFNEKGETLGNLSETRTVFLSGHRELALLLPYIKATVESVTPLSKRRKNAKYALMDVKLELDTGLLPEKWGTVYEEHLKADDEDFWPQSAPWLSVGADFMRKMVLLLAKPKAQRVTMSQSSLKPMQLEGNIDTSEALDDPYSIDSSGASSETSQASDIEPQEVQFGAEEKEDESENERAAVLGMLELMVLTSQLTGVEYPPELLDELERAKNGDESIDIEDLAERFNGASPDIRTADYSQVSFSEGKRAEGRRFSIAVPDGWTVLKDYEENNVLISTIRPFVAVPGDMGSTENISLFDQIIYSDQAGDTQVEEATLERGTDAFCWAIRFYTAYQGIEGFGMGLSPTVWDEEVEAQNTHCLVYLKKPNEGANGAQFFIHPYALDHGDMIRCSFAYEGDEILEQQKKAVLEIAKSVKLDKPVVPSCVKMMETAQCERISAEDFENMIGNFLMPLANLKQMVYDSGERKYYALTGDDNENALKLAGARALAELASHAEPVLSDAMDAYEKQVELGANAEDRRQMLDALQLFVDHSGASPNVFEDDTAKLIEQAGILDPSLELQRLRAKFAELVAASGEGRIDPSQIDDESSFPSDNDASYAGADALIKKIGAEGFKLDVLSDLSAALQRSISIDKFVLICEAIGFGFMQRRQEACNSAASPFNSDEDNAIAMSREFGKFNPIICRYIGYILDVIDAQIFFGTTSSDLAKMIAEAEELMELVASEFSIGDPHLDSVANAQAPIILPGDYPLLRQRLEAIKQ